MRTEPANFEASFFLSINAWLAISGWSFLALAMLDYAGVFAKIQGHGFGIIDLVTSAFKEELSFRLLPLGPLIFFWKKIYIPVLLLMSAIASVAFGLGHGHTYNILLQGCGGFILCLFFIKACSVDSYRSRIFQLRALVITTFAHALYNLVTAKMLD
ncbi:MAG: hypothetical protein G01um10143_761 [Parcubacteria group bacterium Gr01-1014_3]|nr:MAG: hypothetical protein G01um10143_761 [Parcubacteria group bacterium Gr01-1014_3]